jgi:thiamine pyrophosphokinase
MPAEGVTTGQRSHPAAAEVAFLIPSTLKAYTPQQKTTYCVIIANGDPPDPATAQHFTGRADLLLAADGGARHALALNLIPHVVIGDLDSLNEDQEAHLHSAGTRFIVHPTAKDETDLELALLYAVEQGADPIIVLGALGGRLDQMLANVLLLTMPALAGRDVRLIDGPQSAFVVRDQATITGRPGDTVSLIPLGGEVRRITTHGLAYPLTEGTLPFGPALGVSNEMTAPQAHVQVRDGLLLCVHLSLQGTKTRDGDRPESKEA